MSMAIPVQGLSGYEKQGENWVNVQKHADFRAVLQVFLPNLVIHDHES